MERQNQASILMQALMDEIEAQKQQEQEEQTAEE